jgi:hypothetical protein
MRNSQLSLFKKAGRFLIVLVAFVAVACEEEEFPVSFNEYFLLRNSDINYIQNYVPKNLLYFHAITVADSSAFHEVSVSFNQTYNREYLIKAFDSTSTSWNILPEGMLKFTLAKGNSDVVQNNFRLGIFDGDRLLKEERIAFYFYPKELYAAAGQYGSPGYLIAQKYDNSEVPFIRFSPEDWDIVEPSDADKAYAMEEWGALLDEKKDNFENAEILEIDLITTLDPYQGAPSSSLFSLPPFDQYRRLLEGNDRLWCGNWAMIYSNILDSFGYTVRQVAFNNIYNNSQEPNVLLAEGHRALEVFDPETYRWKLVDLTFFMIEATYQGQPLNAYDLHYMINNPMLREHIIVTEYDDEENIVHRIKITESKHYPNYLNYYKMNQRINFLRG